MDQKSKTIGEQWWRSNPTFKPPETPLDSMEFLSRTWSASATEVSRAVVASPPTSQPPQMRFSEIQNGSSDVTLVPEDEENGIVLGNTFSFASSETSLMVMERIMAQSVSNLKIYTYLYLGRNKSKFYYLFSK